jgi:hypothetical protein
MCCRSALELEVPDGLGRTTKGLARYLLDADLGGEPLHIHVSEVGPGHRSHPPHRHGGIEGFYMGVSHIPSKRCITRIRSPFQYLTTATEQTGMLDRVGRLEIHKIGHRAGSRLKLLRGELWAWSRLGVEHGVPSGLDLQALAQLGNCLTKALDERRIESAAAHWRAIVVASSRPPAR